MGDSKYKRYAPFVIEISHFMPSISDLLVAPLQDTARHLADF